jgi:hypothetical protein
MHDKKRCNLELNENRRYPKGGPLEKQGGGGGGSSGRSNYSLGT